MTTMATGDDDVTKDQGNPYMLPNIDGGDTKSVLLHKLCAANFLQVCQN